jgi:hypothetical protein
MTPDDSFGIQQFGGSNGSDLASPGRLEGLRRDGLYAQPMRNCRELAGRLRVIFFWRIKLLAVKRSICRD